MDKVIHSTFRTDLTHAEIEAFGDRGYHIHEQLFSNEEIDEARDACEAICSRENYETGIPPDDVYWRPGDDPLTLRKVDNCWKANAIVKRMVTNSRIGRIVSQLISAPGIRLWHDQFLYKPPNGGRVVTWHQDWAYWQMIRECLTCTCWIALSAVTAESGPMVYLEGSHKLGLYPLPPTVSGHNQLKPTLPTDSACSEVPVLLRSGQVSFHHGLLLHGSGPNSSDSPRLCLISHVMSTECTYQQTQPGPNERRMNEQPDPPRPGERFRGPQFPMIWQSAE